MVVIAGFGGDRQCKPVGAWARTRVLEFPGLSV